MNCVIYLRVSNKEQAQTDEKEGYSIAAQREACMRLVQEKGWKFVDEYADRGESARSAHRPSLQLMLSRIKKQKDVGAVVVHKIDRLARNMEDHVAIKAVLKRSNIQLISVVENIEDSASGRFVEGIHALMAEFYSANLATEIKKGMEQKVKQGGWPHQAPVGYKNIREGSRGVAKVIIDPDTGPHVKEAFNLYSTGNYSLEDIRDFLTDRGVMSVKDDSKPLSLSTVNRVLANPFFIGIVNWSGVQAKGSHEPLIDKDVFEKVQEVTTMRNYAGERKRKHPHFLKGTLFCGECGSRLSIAKAKKKYNYFYCLGTKHGRGCTHTKHVLATDIEKQIEELYEQIQLPKESIKKLVKDFREELVSRQEHQAMEEQFILKKMQRLNSEKLKIVKAYYAGAVPIDVLKIEQDRIADEMATAESRLKVITTQLEHYTEILTRAAELASRCAEAYKNCSDKYKRLFNQAIFEKIYVKDKKISAKDYTELFGALFEQSSDNKHLVEAAGVEPASAATRRGAATSLAYAFKSRAPAPRGQDPVCQSP